MSPKIFYFIILFSSLVSCKKNAQTLSYPSYYGKWQWIGSSKAALFTQPNPDSEIVLILNPGNLYQTLLNAQLYTQGTFELDSTPNRVILHFNNITQPAGTVTSVISGNLTYLYFNYSKIGQLVLFQYNWTSSPGDTLQLVQSPTIPGSTTNYFKRIWDPF